MAEFAEVEAVDGVRMTWNVWPATKPEAGKCVVPTAVVYTPLRSLPTPVLPYTPLRCKSCRSILNPYCTVDFDSRIWICPFCFQRNHFPDHYMGISPSNLPAELFPQYTSVEYVLQPSYSPDVPPVFLFMLDICIVEEELGFLKTALTQAIDLLPGNTFVGLITFGTLVHVHELGFSEVPKSYVFRGSKDATKEQILDELGLLGSTYRGTKPVGVIAGVRDGLSAESINRFLLPVSDCEFTFNSVLEELQRDPWPVQIDKRATRCTSTALTVAASLLGVCVPGSGARIVAFLGGPCTEGSGMIVSKDLSEPLRSHKDLDKGAALHYQKAVKFYETLSRQLVNQGHVLDLFACSLDQVGIAEIKVTVERTGGMVVLAESFGHTVFKDSFKRIFEAGDTALGLSFNGIFELNCSRDLKVQGIIGPCTSLEKKGISCSDNVIGQGNTTAWKMCGLDRSTTLSIFFELVPKELADVVSQLGVQQFYFQFLTHYQHSDGDTRIRCTTVTRRWVGVGENIEDLASGFDQETAAVIMARLASLRMETEDEFDAIKWLDRSLITLSSRFGDYRKDDPLSFNLSARFAIFPQFMFNLRRSQFVQVFNNSLDETAYYRMLLNRETIVNSVVMIQPSLISYSFNASPQPVLLDAAAIAAERILLFDAYFTLVIFHGMTIAEWRRAEYHKQPEHQAFADLLQAPRDDADLIIRERFPVPRLVICDQYGSQARFLLARLNPSVTYKSSSKVIPGGDMIFTDDVSFEVFMEHLQKLAVSQSV